MGLAMYKNKDAAIRSLNMLSGIEIIENNKNEPIARKSIEISSRLIFITLFI